MGRRVYTLAAVNARLESALIGVRVRQKGKRLYLVASLPVKPDDRNAPRSTKQYWVSLKVFANPDGFRYAEGRAQAMGALQSSGFQGFHWHDWAEGVGAAKPVAQLSVAEALDAYKGPILDRLIAKHGGNEVAADRQWRNGYWYAGISKLATMSAINQANIDAAMATFPTDSRAQQRGAIVIGHFLKAMGYEASTDKLRGGYKSSLTRRIVPDDDQIYRTFHAEQLQGARIQTVFVLMAVFGLRDHECFKGEPVVHDGRVLFHVAEDSKTGERWANSNPLEWAKEWHDVIMAMRLPLVTAQINKEYSSYVSRAFRRYELGMTPYSLRHAYGLRGGQDTNIPIPLLAKSMGNSAQTNERYYQKHGSMERQASAWEKAEARSGGAEVPPTTIA